MDELIKLISSQLGIDSKTANAALSRVMALLKSQIGSQLFAQVAGAVPGAEKAAAEAPDPAAGGGLLGKLTSSVSSMFGGKSGAGMEMASALASTGVDVDKIGPMLKTVFAFLREKLGDETVEQIIAKLPMLKSLMGR
ncbi:DUF2780 domain-containing protein [Allorhodopirellula solitaria]|uniref:DUF2267 domain-containing protein n=1 Tax=Allorhodopirellula solitaria TaxID=2527987 RepID=A0A5C5XT68_9BACT|nr:DUF2780 domain-containing protein [Allorhodopirellula solitaria]TWT66447.1 hypothetical protein CA85_25420 [Allorhodopirellula solitaria]